MSEQPSRPQPEDVQAMLAERVNEWFDEAEDKGFKRGIERGRAAERALLCRIAARKFDAETAERLAETLERVASPGDLAKVGEAIIDCDTGAVLLDRVSRAAPPSASRPASVARRSD